MEQVGSQTATGLGSTGLQSPDMAEYIQHAQHVRPVEAGSMQLLCISFRRTQSFSFGTFSLHSEWLSFPSANRKSCSSLRRRTRLGQKGRATP